MQQLKKAIQGIKLDTLKKINKNTILLAIAGVAVIAMVVVVLMNFAPADEAVAKEAVDYINTNLLQGQGTATLDSVSRESGLIKFKIKISDQTFDSYATKDGKLFFPQAFDLTKDPSAQENTQPIQ